MTGVPDQTEESEMVHIDELLDEALDETFPSSDPVQLSLHPQPAEAAEEIASTAVAEGDPDGIRAGAATAHE